MEHLAVNYTETGPQIIKSVNLAANWSKNNLGIKFIKMKCNVFLG